MVGERRRAGLLMEDVQIQLAALWVAVMLTYLLGDVLRIFSGDATPGRMGGVEAKPWMWMTAAVLMLVPIAMLVLSVMVHGDPVQWANLIAAVGLFVFNLFGLPTYSGAYDRFLTAVSMGLNVLTFWTAWSWQPV